MSVNLYETARCHIPRDGNNHNKYPFTVTSWGSMVFLNVFL